MGGGATRHTCCPHVECKACKTSVTRKSTISCSLSSKHIGTTPNAISSANFGGTKGPGVRPENKLSLLVALLEAVPYDLRDRFERTIVGQASLQRSDQHNNCSKRSIIS